MTWNPCLLLVLVASCTTTKTSTTPEPTSLVITRAEPYSPEPGAPCGWIYAFHRPEERPNLCVYVWQNETWSLASESGPGAFQDELARGCILTGTAVGFPTDELRDAGMLYVAGQVDALLDGEAISREASAPSR
jgi:hypothetical protein